MLVVASSAFWLPAFGARASRIAAAEGLGLRAALPDGVGIACAAAIVATAIAMVFIPNPGVRLAIAGAATLGLLMVAGLGADHLMLTLGEYGRVSPGAALWVWLAVALLWFADALARLERSELARSSLAIGLFLAVGGVASLGYLDAISVMIEYRARARSFQHELAVHAFLALGSFSAAVAIGFPLGLYLHRHARLRGPVLSVLTALQTVPSIALFGLMILPLSWLAREVPAVARLGISGIGFAPAFAALLLYSLLPVVANTIAGLRGLPPAVQEAAQAMGMTGHQQRWQVEVPLALPIILTGARIVLVQNIGLATVGALIGAGGLGTFVFQGLAQGAMDLVLLGTIPTVVLAFSAAKSFDIAIAQTAGARS